MVPSVDNLQWWALSDVIYVLLEYGFLSSALYLLVDERSRDHERRCQNHAEVCA